MPAVKERWKQTPARVRREFLHVRDIWNRGPRQENRERRLAEEELRHLVDFVPQFIVVAGRPGRGSINQATESQRNKQIVFEVMKRVFVDRDVLEIYCQPPPSAL